MTNQLIAYSSLRDLFNYTNVFGNEYYLSSEKAINQFREQYKNTEDRFMVVFQEFESIKRKYEMNEISALEGISLLDKWLYDMIENTVEFDWEILIHRVGRNQIFHVVEEFNDRIPDEMYWMLIAECYQSSDFAFDDYAFQSKFLLSKRPKRECLMVEEDRLFFESLPENVKIYRGCSVIEKNSGKYRFSWTLDKKTAEFFAYEYHRNSKIKSTVIELIVPKASLFAYFSDRGESEVLYLHSNTLKQSKDNITLAC